MDNITRLKAQPGVYSVLVLLNELDRMHGADFTKAFVEEHKPGIVAAIEAIERALDFDNRQSWVSHIGPVAARVSEAPRARFLARNNGLCRARY